MSDPYRQSAADARLGHVIDAYWVHEPRVARPAAAGLHDRVLPDGCIDLIFASGGGSASPRLFTSALIDEPLALPPARPGWFVGVRFRPGMSHAALPLEPGACRDRDHSAVDVDPGFAALEDELARCGSAAAALAVLRREVDERVHVNAHRVAPPRVQHAVALLRGGPEGALPVHQVARAVGSSERSLHRELVRWTGLAPKVLARIFRMQGAVERLRGGRASLLTVAVELGYADQAHMTRELARMTGLTPGQLARARDAGRNLQDRRPSPR